MTRTLFVNASLCVLALVLHVEAQNPCHDGRQKKVMGAFSCDVVVLPSDLCSNCRLRTANEDGVMRNCKSFHDLNANGCMEKIDEYTRDNPCDEKRKKWFDERNMEKLDYFVYSVCETCCDCIPLKAKASQYQMRKADGTLVKVIRGNCAAHAEFDVCKVLPNIRSMVLKEGASAQQQIEGLRASGLPPKVCAPLTEWVLDAREIDKSFKDKNHPGLPGVIKRFLKDLNFANQCRRMKIWERCVDLETKQGRIG
eukprot:TRINITY_DN345_c0_g1_i1.p1 TRINITY_DN345_c0_g1~~TRINITY_DN345_c0_g1_i1.p1  ORF type:complete len:254 (-),score=33.52 TRINITY_DN345_c0_g1_i1:142-903(-)